MCTFLHYNHYRNSHLVLLGLPRLHVSAQEGTIIQSRDLLCLSLPLYEGVWSRQGHAHLKIDQKTHAARCESCSRKKHICFLEHEISVRGFPVMEGYLYLMCCSGLAMSALEGTLVGLDGLFYKVIYVISSTTEKR